MFVPIGHNASLRNPSFSREHRDRERLLYRNRGVAFCLSRSDARHHLSMGRIEGAGNDRSMGTKYGLWVERGNCAKIPHSFRSFLKKRVCNRINAAATRHIQATIVTV